MESDGWNLSGQTLSPTSDELAVMDTLCACPLLRAIEGRSTYKPWETTTMDLLTLTLNALAEIEAELIEALEALTGDAR